MDEKERRSGDDPEIEGLVEQESALPVVNPDTEKPAPERTPLHPAVYIA